MTDVPELRSLFMTKNVKEREGTPPRTSGGEFGETISRCSRTAGDLPDSALSPDGTPGLPGPGGVDPEMAGENGDGAVSASLCASGGSVPDPMGDFKGDQQGPFPKNGGARAYLGLFSRDGVPSEESLCENFRHLKLSARAFEENPDLMPGEASSWGVQEKEGENDQEPDVSGEGSLVFLGATEREPMVARDGSAGIPVEGALPLAESFLQREDKVPAAGPAKRIFSPDVSGEGILKELPAVPSELSSTVIAGSPESFSADPADPLWSHVSPEGEPVASLQEPFTGKVKTSAIAGAARVNISEGVFEIQREHVFGHPSVPPVAGANVYGKGSPAPEPFHGAPETFSQTLETEGEPGSVKLFPRGEATASLLAAESAGGNLLSGASRPDPEAGDVPLAPFVPADGEVVAPGPDPDVLTKNEDASSVGSVGSTAQEGPGGRVLEGSKDLTTGDDDLSSPPVAVNPMEPMSVERAGREVLLEARGAEAMARGLAETVHVVRKRDGHRGTIEVSPPNLGQVRITIESSGDTVRIHLRVESVQVRDMLDQTADVLKQSMEDRGLSLAGMSVDVGGQGADGNSRGWGSASESFHGSFGESGEAPVEDEAEEVIARLDLERGMLHWVA